MSWLIVTTLAVMGALAWWLSGYDALLTGDDHRADLIRRAVRCGITLILLAVGLIGLRQGGLVGGWMFISITVPLGITWAGCLSELFAGVFRGLVDSEDKREFDPKQTSRDLDRLAQLVRGGRDTEAVELCRRLKESCDISTLAVEAVLFQLYRRVFDNDGPQAGSVLAEIQQLRQRGNVAEAESMLSALLIQEPGNLAASFLLMRIYARDNRRVDRAIALLKSLERQNPFPPAFVDHARRCISEWGGIVPPKSKSTEGIESLLVGRTHSKASGHAIDPNAASIDELLAAGHLATAIELLERKTTEEPQNYEAWLKLAEAHGFHCCNASRAAKIIRKIETNPAFSKEQVRFARDKLEAWRARSGG